jgi:hypothetical protein
MTNESTVYSAISGIAIDTIQLQWFPVDFTPKWVEVGTGGTLPVGFLTSAFVRLVRIVEKSAPQKCGSVVSSPPTFPAPALVALTVISWKGSVPFSRFPDFADNHTHGDRVSRRHRLPDFAHPRPAITRAGNPLKKLQSKSAFGDRISPGFELRDSHCPPDPLKCIQGRTVCSGLRGFTSPQNRCLRLRDPKPPGPVVQTKETKTVISACVVTFGRCQEGPGQNCPLTPRRYSDGLTFFQEPGALSVAMIHGTARGTRQKTPTNLPPGKSCCARDRCRVCPAQPSGGSGRTRQFWTLIAYSVPSGGTSEPQTP